jgi:hypothetical protein
MILLPYWYVAALVARRERQGPEADLRALKYKLVDLESAATANHYLIRKLTSRVERLEQDARLSG